jgi:hypothetical protein
MNLECNNLLLRISFVKTLAPVLTDFSQVLRWGRD